MEQSPPQEPKNPTDKPVRRRYPAIPPIHQLGSKNPDQVEHVLDALVPSILEQEAAATRAFARERGVEELSTEQTQFGFAASEWAIDGRTVYVGPAEHERVRTAIEFASRKFADEGGAEVVPPTIDDIRFGSASIGKTVLGEVITAKTLTPQGQSPKRGLFARLEARHAAPRKEWNWRRRTAAGFAAAVALTSAVFFGAGVVHDSTPKPERTISAPAPTSTPTATPETNRPSMPAEEVPRFAFEDGNNSYEYTKNDQGEIMQIEATLGQDENPWTLTEGAYKLLIEDAPDSAVEEADVYMQSPGTRQEALHLQAGTRQTWQVVYRGDKARLKA
jgi:hypothetical protein